MTYIVQIIPYSESESDTTESEPGTEQEVYWESDEEERAKEEKKEKAQQTKRSGVVEIEVEVNNAMKEPEKNEENQRLVKILVSYQYRVNTLKTIPSVNQNGNDLPV